MKKITIAFALTSILIALISMSTISTLADPGTPGKKKPATSKKSEATVYPPSPYKIIIDKSDYTMMLYDQDGGWQPTP